MVKASLKTWIQLIGLISIVASLTFVGLKMRQSQRIAQAGQQQDRTASFLNLFTGNSEKNKRQRNCPEAG